MTANRLPFAVAMFYFMRGLRSDKSQAVTVEMVRKALTA